MLRASGAVGVSLTGNEFGSSLIGGRGDERLNGGAGDDHLVGRSGADIFAFGVGSGQDTIGDFKARISRLDFSAYHLGDFVSLTAAMRKTGSDTVIALDANNSVILTGVRSSQLRASDSMT